MRYIRIFVCVVTYVRMYVYERVYAHLRGAALGQEGTCHQEVGEHVRRVPHVPDAILLYTYI